MRFHISSKTGNPAVCKAQLGKCPLGGEHFENAEEAYLSLDKSVRFPTPLRKSWGTVFRVGSPEVRVSHFPELDYVLAEIDRYCPEGRSTRGGSLFFSASKNASKRWSRGSKESAVVGTVDPENTYIYPIGKYEVVSNRLGNLFVHNRDCGTNLEPSEELCEAIRDYWESGVTLVDFWRRVESGDVPLGDVENFEIFVSNSQLLGVKVLSKGFDYSVE